jgi:hypothetical protein
MASQHTLVHAARLVESPMQDLRQPSQSGVPGRPALRHAQQKNREPESTPACRHGRSTGAASSRRGMGWTNVWLHIHRLGNQRPRLAATQRSGSANAKSHRTTQPDAAPHYVC